MRILLYSELNNLWASTLSGIFIFADVETLSSQTKTDAAKYIDHLQSSGRALRVINHPTRSLGRYAIHRTLLHNGINNHNVYYFTDWDQVQRFPVFIRAANKHNSIMTKLLHDQKQLIEAMESLNKNPSFDPETTLICEYVDTADSEGVYRNYTAFRIGDSIFPGMIAFGKKWEVRGSMPQEEEHFNEQLTHIRKHPASELIKLSFDLANIQYGRIDYSIHSKGISVWEINTHPNLGLLNYAKFLAGPASKLRLNTRVPQRFIGSLLLDSFNSLALTEGRGANESSLWKVFSEAEQDKTNENILESMKNAMISRPLSPISPLKRTVFFLDRLFFRNIVLIIFVFNAIGRFLKKLAKNILQIHFDWYR
jgi:hypothetical protein